MDLGYLLKKNPHRAQVFELSWGRAYVFYPEVGQECTTVALALEIDPIDLARGKVGSNHGGLFDYVNDRPYASSSFMSTAIAKVFGTAMTGRGDDHQALADSALDLTAEVTMLPCRGEQAMLNRVFEPLGYAVSFESFAADEQFPAWGESAYVNLTIRGQVRLRDLLKHLYVLIPVFDRQKHYWVGPDEVEKLLRIGEDWLADHPEKGYITGRYLARRRSLVNLAFERLASANAVDGEVLVTEPDPTDDPPRITLNEHRLSAVMAALKNSTAKRVIDLGCGEGNLLKLLAKDTRFTQVTGVDVSHVELERAARGLNLDRAPERVRERVTLLQGSLTYKDARFANYDAACLVEVIEHLDPSRLAALERVVFEFARPALVILTTPNREYNSNYDHILPNGLRHSDHRFEWTRAQFQAWATRVGEAHRYEVTFEPVGEIDEVHGAPTQMGVFSLC
jgi:3' terminal RNA ribose 2'-O-methyltransferase Hen1